VYSWPNMSCSSQVLRASAAVTHVGVVGHGLVAHSQLLVELSHGVVRVLESVLFPKALLLQVLPGCLPLLQRDPKCRQKGSSLNPLHLYVFH